MEKDNKPSKGTFIALGGVALVFIAGVVILVVAGLIALGYMLYKNAHNSTPEEAEDTVELVETVETETTPTNDAESLFDDGEYTITGTVANSDIVMTLNIESSGEVTGSYYYVKSGPDNYMDINGYVSDDKKEMKLMEYYGGNYSGEWYITISNDGALEATMANYKGQTFDAKLEVVRVMSYGD